MVDRVMTVQRPLAEIDALIISEFAESEPAAPALDRWSIWPAPAPGQLPAARSAPDGEERLDSIEDTHDLRGATRAVEDRVGAAATAPDPPLEPPPARPAAAILAWSLLALGLVAVAVAFSVKGTIHRRPAPSTAPIAAVPIEPTPSARSVRPEVTPLAAPPAAAPPSEPSAPRAPAEPVRSRPPRHASGAPGYLTLDTEPWATAYLGTRRLGTTPFARISLPAGQHRLTLDPKNSGHRRPVTVKIDPGAETRLAIRLR
jgi:hypothetical protein